MAREQMIREQAVAWAVQTGDPHFEDWDGFTSWLEQSPDHSRAYDEVMLAVDEAGAVLPAIPLPANDEAPAIRRARRRWFSGAIAAVAAGAIAFGAWHMRPATYSIETAPGETQLVTLDGGGQVAIAGDTRLILDRDNPGVATLERGQVLFTLQHDSDRPFRVTVGEDTLVDIGTIFEVERTGDRMSVAVSEGAVVFNPGRQNVRVSPGQMLSRETGSDDYRLQTVPAEQVGEWQQGRLTFTDASLAEVAADLSRATGARFVVAARAADTRVSGSLLIEPVRRDPREVGPLLGVHVGFNGEAWEIGTP